jgi:hypothetical protein
LLNKKYKEERGCSMYIISYSVKLENEKNNYEVIIRPPAEMSGFF